MSITMRERKHYGSQYHRKIMGKCTVEDFTSRGIIVDEMSELPKIVRFCPHVDVNNEPFFKIKNAYNNDKLRNSFSVEILTCFNKKPGYCKSQEELIELLDATFFNFYIISEMIDFRIDQEEKIPKELEGKPPHTSTDYFHS